MIVILSRIRQAFSWVCYVVSMIQSYTQLTACRMGGLAATGYYFIAHNIAVATNENL